MPRPTTQARTTRMTGQATVSTVDVRKRRVAVIVLGMHRSGTSALARLFALLGCALPAHLMDGNASNPAGHWESDAIRVFNDAVLDSAGSVWNDLLPFNSQWYRSPVFEGFVEKGLDLVDQEFAEAPLFVLKDPRMCRIMPLWMKILERAQIAPTIVIPIRNPLEVAESLAQRDGSNPARSVLLWLRYVLDAEQATRGMARCFTTYDELLSRWAAISERVAEVHDLAWPRSALSVAGEIDGFLNVDLRHNARAREDVLENLALVSWLRKTYAILLEWTVKGGSETAAQHDELDEIRHALDDAAPAFARPLDALVRAEDELARIRAEHEAAVERIAALDAHMAAVEPQWFGMKAHILALEGAVADRDLSIAQAAREAEALHGALEHGRHQFETDRSERESQQDDLQRRLTEVLAAGDAAAVLAEKQHHEIADLRDQLALLASDRAQRHEECDQAWARVADLEAAAGQSVATIAQLRAELDEADAWVARLAADRRAAEDAAKSAERRMAMQGRRLSAAEAEARRLGEELARQAKLPIVSVPWIDEAASRQDKEVLADLTQRNATQEAELATLRERLSQRADELAQLRLDLSEACAASFAAQQQASATVDRARREMADAEDKRVAAALALAESEQTRVAALHSMQQAQRAADERLHESGHLRRELASARDQVRVQTSAMQWLKQVDHAMLARPRWWFLLMPFGWQRARAFRRLCSLGLFDAKAYLAANPDVAASDMDPLQHYISHGLEEGRARG